MTENTPMQPPQHEHHYTSIHQPDFPPEVYWIRQCTICHHIDGELLAFQVQQARA